MSYFRYFQPIEYRNVVTPNILSRVKIPKNLLNIGSLYHPYQIEEGDRPDTIADLYYNDSTKDWLIRLVNNIFDEATHWPLQQVQLDRFISSKYPDINPFSAIHSYKLNTNIDPITSVLYDGLANELKQYWRLQPVTGVYYIIQRDWSITPDTFTRMSVEERMYWSPVTYYDYEFEINESKRNIRLIDVKYADELETVLKDILQD